LRLHDRSLSTHFKTPEFRFYKWEK
jgi:hypothetical protein